MSDKDRCLKFDLPRHKQVNIFVDAETESKPTMASMGAGGECNVFFATIHLDRLGVIPTLYRSFGLLSRLYVMKWSETLTQTMSEGTSEGAQERDHIQLVLPHN